MKTIIENQKKIEELKKKILILENEIDDCENAEKLVKENEDKIVDLQKLLIDQLENKIEVLTQKLEKLKNAESSKHLLKQRAIISELTLLLDMLNKGQKISSIAEEIVYDINQTESEGIPVSLKDDNVIKLKKSKIDQDFEARIDDLEPTIEKMELQAIAEASDVLDEVKSSISEEMIDNLDILNEDIKSTDEKIEDVEKEQELENLDEIEKNLIEEDIELSIKNDAIDNVLKEAHDLEINLDAELKSEDTLKEEDVVEDKILIEEETSKFEENFDDAINSEKTDDLKIANKSEDLITANATDDISGESVELLSFDKPADIFSEEANNIDKQIDNFDEIKEDLKIDENQQSIEQLENLVNLDDLEKLEDDINLDADEKIEVSEAEKEIDILKDELNEELEKDIDNISELDNINLSEVEKELQDVDLDKEMNNFINDELKELENIADTTLSEFSSSMRQDEEKYKDLTPEEKQSKLTELAKNAKEYEVLNNYEDAIKIYKEIVILAEDLALEVLKEKIQNKISELELKL